MNAPAARGPFDPAAREFPFHGYFSPREMFQPESVVCGHIAVEPVPIFYSRSTAGLLFVPTLTFCPR